MVNSYKRWRPDNGLKGDYSDRGSVYRSYWAQWKSLAVRDSILIRYLESTDCWKKTVQRIVPRSKVKEVLEEIHGGSYGGHLRANKTPIRSGSNITG